MAKKHDYKAIKVLIEMGDITTFRQLFDHAYRTDIAKDLGIYYSKFVPRQKHVDLFTIRELYQLARAIGIDGKKMVDLVVNQFEQDKAARLRGKK